jgi:hypothetical protein
MDAARGVTVTILGLDDGASFHGAAILRPRPHPVTGDVVVQIGVPDDALGFRPRHGNIYRIRIAGEGEAPDVERTARAVWLERVQSSWWFILDDADGARPPR